MDALLSFLVLSSVLVGCGDMKGDTDPRFKKGEHGAGEGSQEWTVFACGSVGCFSGTQYCLQMQNSGDGRAGSVCLNLPNDCRARRCLEFDARQQRPQACDGEINYQQTDSRITILCRRR